MPWFICGQQGIVISCCPTERCPTVARRSYRQTLIVVAAVLALAAGFILSTWWATVMLAVATAVGAGIAIWVAVLLSPPGSIMGPSGMEAVLGGFTWFAILGLAPLIVVLFIGSAIGWWRRVGTV